MRRKRRGDGEEETLVPDGGGGAVFVGFGRETTARIDPEDNIGGEVSGAPVDILQVFGGYDGYVEGEWRLRR